VDSEKIGAKYENGILRINIPKKEESKPRPARQIAIA
jgi:HSP20 family protein